MTRAVRLSSGEGPLGTGVFLLRLRDMQDHKLEGQAWLLIAFLPIAPRGRVGLAEKPGPQAGAGHGRLYDEEGPLPLRPGDAATTYARGAAGLAFVLGCMTMACLCAAESSWLGGLGVLLGGALPLALVGWLDQTLPRRRVVRSRA